MQTIGKSLIFRGTLCNSIFYAAINNLRHICEKSIKLYLDFFSQSLFYSNKSIVILVIIYHYVNLNI